MARTEPTVCPSCRTPIPANASSCPKCTDTKSGVPRPVLEEMETRSGASGGRDDRACGVQLFAPGAVIDGKYAVIGRIGSGGFGDVYQARHQLLDRDFALKILHPMLAVSPPARERFFREARTLLDLIHPRIVPLREVGEWQGHLYIAMDLCPGDPLSALLHQHGRFPAAVAARVAIQILEALDYAHTRGVIHRDLKPSNLLVTDFATGRPEARLVDFGVAKVLQQADGGEGEPANLTESGAIVGTLAYMSPEQVDSQEIDGRADLYSLGVVLYEMIVGQRPFRGRSPAQLIKQVIMDVPRAFGKLGTEEGLPGLEGLVMRAMAKRAVDRPGSAAEMRGALEAMLAPSGATGPPVSVLRDAPTTRRRSRSRRGERSRDETSTTTARLEAVGLPCDFDAGAPTLPPRLPSEWGPPARDYNTGHDLFGRSPARALEIWERLAGCKDARVAAWALAARVIAPVIGGDLDTAQEELLRLENHYPEAPVTRSAHILVEDRLAARARIAFVALRDLAEKTIKAGTAIAQEDPYADSVKTVKEFLAGKEAAPITDEVRTYLEDLLGRRDRTVALHHRGYLTRARAMMREGDWKGARTAAERAQRHEATAKEAAEILSDIKRHIFGVRLSGWNAHTGTVHCLAFSPDGSTLVSAGEDGGIRLWDARDPAQVRSLGEDSEEVWAVAFDPRGRWMASAGDSGAIKIWDEERTKVVRTCPGDGNPLWCLAVHPGGTLLAAGGATNELRLWNVQNGSQVAVLRGHTRPVLSLAFDPQGKVLASASRDQTVRLWQIRPPRELRQLPGRDATVLGIACAPDGKTIVGAGEDGTVRFWTVAEAAEPRDVRVHEGAVACITFAPDGRLIASGGEDHAVRLWSPSTGRETKRLVGQSMTRATCLAFSANGRTLACAHRNGEISLWNVAGGGA